MRPGAPGEEPTLRKGAFNLDPTEQTNFSMSHRHSGLHGDGKKVPVGFLDTTSPFAAGAEALYIPVNAPTSGRQYRIQVVEVTDPDTQQIQAVLQVVPA